MPYSAARRAYHRRYQRLLRAWYRATLLLALASPDDEPRCARCGSPHRLEIDHVAGRGWENPSALSSTQRWRVYWAEFLAGVPLRILCRWCNAGYLPGRRTLADKELFDTGTYTWRTPDPTPDRTGRLDRAASGN